MLKINKALGGGSYKSLLAGSLVFLGAFGTTLLASSIFVPIQPTNAEDIGAVINSSGYFINLTSGNAGTVAMDLIATSGGSIGIAKNTINIKSNAPEGYDLYLSMNNNQADGNRLYKDANPGTTTSPNPYLSPTSGTFTNPTPLDTNSWGYALSSTTPGLPASTTPFNTVYDPSAPNTNALFAAMPLQGQEQLIQTITTPDATNGINTDIYYGVNANVSLPSGVYKGTVTYTAIARATTNTNSITAVSPSTTTKLEGGEPLTITTMLGVNAADAEDPGDPANGIPEKRVSVAIGGQNCPITGLSNAQDGSLLIHCTSPSMATGRYDVAVDIPKYDKFWVMVNGIQYKYTEQDQQTAIGDAVNQVTGGNATAADIMLGKTAYVGGVELTGTMPSYTLQYDTNKTVEQNTQDAGLTWSADNKTLTIAEGYHTEQQVESLGGGGNPDLANPLYFTSNSLTGLEIGSSYIGSYYIGLGGYDPVNGNPTGVAGASNVKFFSTAGIQASRYGMVTFTATSTTCSFTATHPVTAAVTYLIKVKEP